MAFSRSLHRSIALALASVLGAAVVGAPLRQARAADNVSSTGEAGTGIGGGALLGAEIPMIVEGIAGVRSGWVYFISAVLGAGGGGFAGYEIENGASDGRPATYMLAAGLALVIPTWVLTLNATRYQPEEGATEDRTPGPAAEPGAPGGSSITSAPGAAPTPPPPPPPAPGAAPAPPPQSLLDLNQGALRLGVPVVAVRPAFSVTEAKAYGLRDNPTELRLPVLHIAF
jgi:hypothetical protein